MTLGTLSKFPAPYFGGKRHAAPTVWAALGDVVHYVEPFCGTCAVLLERPHPCNRPYYSETVNDTDGFLINALRAIAYYPEATAEAASWYVSEADVMARHLALIAWAQEGHLDELKGTPTACDPQRAGYWLYGLCAWIGSGWCSGRGPWVLDRATGRITRRPGTREPGVGTRLPHMGDDGRGVFHAGTREPGVEAAPAAPGVEAFHPMTMPELRRWFVFLSARLRHVRIVHGDWTRVLTKAVRETVDIRNPQKSQHCGIFLDPPYSQDVRATQLYTHDGDAHGDLNAAVRAWCLANGTNRRYRIVLAGFAGEGHEELVRAGWWETEWFREGHLRGGMANRNPEGHQQARERLWMSPHCLRPAPDAQLGLW